MQMTSFGCAPTSRAGRCHIIEQDFTREQRSERPHRPQVDPLGIGDRHGRGGGARAIEVVYIRELRSNDPSSATTVAQPTSARPEQITRRRTALVTPGQDKRHSAPRESLREELSETGGGAGHHAQRAW